MSAHSEGSKTRARTGPRSVALFLKFLRLIVNVDIAQLMECLTGAPEDLGSIHDWEELNSF